MDLKISEVRNVELVDGTAVAMGDGVFGVLQKDEYGSARNLVLTRGDLEPLLAAS